MTSTLCYSDAVRPNYVQTLKVKGANGEIKELVFPKGLDLDRPKRARTTFNHSQLVALETEFTRNQYLIGRERSSLATKLGLSETQVKVWYQNRRTKHKKDRERDSELRSFYPFCLQPPSRDGAESRTSGEFEKTATGEPVVNQRPGSVITSDSSFKFENLVQSLRSTAFRPVVPTTFHPLYYHTKPNLKNPV